MANPIVNGQVEPLEAYAPRLCVTTMFKTYALKCGACEKDFVKFSVFGKPTCPYCGVKNVPVFYPSY